MHCTPFTYWRNTAIGIHHSGDTALTLLHWDDSWRIFLLQYFFPQSWKAECYMTLQFSLPSTRTHQIIQHRRRQFVSRFNEMPGLTDCKLTRGRCRLKMPGAKHQCFSSLCTPAAALMALKMISTFPTLECIRNTFGKDLDDRTGLYSR